LLDQLLRLDGQRHRIDLLSLLPAPWRSYSAKRSRSEHVSGRHMFSNVRRP
jgi:hypothetical protein